MANKTRLIDVMSAVTKMSGRVTPLIRTGESSVQVYNEVLRVLAEAPTVDAEPVVHAYWIKEQDEHGVDRGWKCSNCRGSVYKMTYEPYEGCPHCRAKMDGGNEDV